MIPVTPRRVAERLREMKAAMRAETNTTGRDIVIVKGAIVSEQWQQQGVLLGRARSARRATDSSAYFAGRTAGDFVNLSRQRRLGQGD